MFARLAVIVCLAVGFWAAFARPSGGSAGEHRYVVRPYDTLWSIAASNYAGDPRAAVWEIQDRNRLSGTMIRPGQVIVLP